MASAFSDPIFWGIILALIGFFFFIYLMVRRTIVGFSEGYRESRK